jgi:hypothetical protein
MSKYIIIDPRSIYINRNNVYVTKGKIEFSKFDSVPLNILSWMAGAPFTEASDGRDNMDRLTIRQLEDSLSKSIPDTNDRILVLHHDFCGTCFAVYHFESSTQRYLWSGTLNEKGNARDAQGNDTSIYKTC